MLRVGLTGGIASGKSTVASILRGLDYPVLDADPIGHEMLEPDQPAYDEIVAEFGKQALDADGKVNRGKLAQIVFGDAQKRNHLNQILHPRIRTVVQKWFVALDRPEGPDLAVVEAALIIEAEYQKDLDKVIVCWCRPDQQLERLIERGLTLEQARQRIAAQMPMDEKRRLADEVIDCSCSFDETEGQVVETVKRLLQSNASNRGV
ncbi:MAG: dephospho-CoA kinase [Candidatus Acidiferrales bacterium]